MRLSVLAVLLVGDALAHRLHAAFTAEQGHTLFSDRFASLTDTAFAIPLREDELGLLVAYVDDRVHLFCHCDHCIYRCLWGRPTCTSLQKMNVLRGLKAWHASAVSGKELRLATLDPEEVWAWEHV